MSELTNPNPMDMSIIPPEQITSSITAAASAYQLAMDRASTSTNPPLPVNGLDSRDVAMAGTLTPSRPASPAILPPNSAHSPLPRVGTPSRSNGEATSNSRATSVHPDVAPSFPKVAAPNGAPARRYMNEKITPHLLEAMKTVVKEQPDDPLRALGELLLQKSRELEGT